MAVEAECQRTPADDVPAHQYLKRSPALWNELHQLNPSHYEASASKREDQVGEVDIDWDGMSGRYHRAEADGLKANGLGDSR